MADKTLMMSREAPHGAAILKRRALVLEWSAVPFALALDAFLVGWPQDVGFGMALTMAALFALTIWIVWQDLVALTIADSAVLALALLALGLRFSAGAAAGDRLLETVLAILVDAGLPGGLLWLFREIHYRRKGYDGLGLGDVKLAAAGGILVGAAGLSWALCGASILALAFVALRHYRGDKLRPSGQDKIALGAVLAPAIWAVALCEQLPALLPFVLR